MKHDSFEELQQRLQLRFHKPRLLKQAFTHTSYVNEHKQKELEHNERLEFLGDAVLQLTVSEHLYRTFPERPEGQLTRMRASIVCEPSLARFADMLAFGAHVLLGRGEEQLGGRQRPALLADLFESFIGAIYLDQGIEAVRTFLAANIFPHIDIDGGLLVKDYKSTLQERAQHAGMSPIEYRIKEERGPAHDREFVVEVHIGEQKWGMGIGRTKKEAEQQAAAEAWRHLFKQA
ncbi:ribonuclease III [Paenibacillus oenotherae]|uniref:Ribonuclease 3 n=1 Tax=Paenibacillus oenotherae TaxID=1435645 RepID=A0ABS7D0F9_9BACL|nr:ribonuclease III [Paenibacillus oenotherae]MBW7473332.1 ribonuclease III [Paenibacillus oenotherae]